MVTLRDRNGPAASHRERTDTVPRFAGQGMSTLLAVYQSAGRTRASDVPKLLVNPRATVSYGADTLRFYVEAYGERPGTRLVARALDQGGHEIWHDTVALAGTEALATGLALLRPGELPVGAGRFEIGRIGAGSGATRTAPFLGELLGSIGDCQLRADDQPVALFRAPGLGGQAAPRDPDERPTVWREFYKATDPVEITPENEALDGYFRRIQIANQRFRESGIRLADGPGRGVHHAGEPDDVFDFATDVSRAGVRGVRWTYNAMRLTLFFQDNTGFGRYRLTPLFASRVPARRGAARRQ